MNTRCRIAAAPIRFRALTAIGALIIGSACVYADTSVYARTRTTVNCGVLALRANPYATNPVYMANPDPFVFYVLDQRRDVKPGGWTFDNPFAVTVATTNEATRWGSAGLAPGDRIRKDMAPYWEVDLSNASTNQLSQYDVLLLHTTGTVTLTPTDREKLRRFVDGGGLLWIDRAGGMNFNTGNGLFVPLSFGGGTSVQQILNFNHPLLWSPYVMFPAEALSLGSEPGTANSADLIMQGIWAPVVADANGAATLTGATYGSGHIVVTATNVAASISRPVGRSGLACGTNFFAAGVGELKLAFNMVRWANAHQTAYKNSNRNNSNAESIGAPLAEKWTAQMNTTDMPAIYNGILFVVGTDLTVGTVMAAYDTVPNRDLDGDGNADDGARKGGPAGGPLGDRFLTPSGAMNATDLVWSVAVPGRVSAPTVVDVMVPGDNRGARPLVLLTDTNGNMVAYRPFPTDSNGILQPTQPISETITCPAQLSGVYAMDRIPSPTYSEGMIYVTAPKGVYLVRVVRSNNAARLVRMTTDGSDEDFRVWSYPSVSNPFGTQLLNVPPPMTPATVGYIPQSGGASDRVIYYGTRGGQTGPINVGAAMRALWLGARGEELRPSGYNPNNPTQTYTRWYSPRLQTTGLRIYNRAYEDDIQLGFILRDSAGNRINGVTVEPTTKNQFLLTVPVVGPVYADYSIDWDPQPGLGLAPPVNIQRSWLSVPDVTQFNSPAPLYKQQIQGALALGQNGLLMMITDGDDNNGGGGHPGSLWVFQERGGSQNKVLYRWQLPGTTTGTFTQTLSNQTTETIVGLPAVDPIFARGPAQPLRSLQWVKGAAPVERNGVIYAMAKGKMRMFGFDAPVGVLLAFDANPPAFNIKTGGTITGINNNVIVRQPDLQKAVDPQYPDQLSSYTYLDTTGQAGSGQSQTVVDRATGVIHINNFSRVANGAVMDGSVSVSLPVGIQFGGGSEEIRAPDQQGSKWSPLLWFMVFPFFDAQATPMVSGDTLYIAGSQMLPPTSHDTATSNIMVYAIDANIPPNDPFLVPVRMPNSIGVKQMTIATARNGIQPNPHVRWPSGEGIASFDDWIRKVRNARTDGTKISGLVGSDGMLVLSTDTSVRIYERALTIIADSARIIEVDSEGFPTLSMDATLSGQPFSIGSGADVVAPAVKSTKLVQPTKVYRVTPTEFMVVDTGGNRVVRVNRSGFETRSITDFIVDSDWRPVGFREGDTTALKGPRDAIFWADYVPNSGNPFRQKSNTGLEYWAHYLIADTGNNRMIEIVDRYAADPSTRAVLRPVMDGETRQVGQLFWHSPSNEVGRKYAYTAVQRVEAGVQNNYPVYAFVMAFGNTEPQRATSGLDQPTGVAPREAPTGSGGIVVQGGGYRLIVNAIRYNHWNRMTNRYEARTIQVRDPLSIDARFSLDGSGKFDILVATSEGVFVLTMPNDPASTATTWPAKLAITNDDYSFGLRWWVNAASQNGGSRPFRVTEGIPFRAGSARWMPNGDIMITNSWSGRVFLGDAADNSGRQPADPQYDFFGEVMVLRTRFYSETRPFHGWVNPYAGANTPIVQSIPPLVGTSGLKQPQFADRPF